MDNVLLLTILMIFAAAVVGMIIRYRTRDKCLKGFEGFFVTIELEGGKLVWGRLAVYHNAVELIYPSPHLDPSGKHYETSFILYQEQFKDIVAVKRLHDELTPDNQERRKREVEETYHPSFGRRTLRRLRNTINLMRDAVAQAFSAFMGQMKKTTSSTLISTQDSRISSTAKQIISASASAYEPILEKYIGRKVVVEVAGEDGIREKCGILKEYTDQFICALNIPVEEQYAFNIADREQLAVNRNIDFEISASPGKAAEDVPTVDLVIKVTNKSKRNMHISHAEWEAYKHSFEVEVPAGGSLVLDLASVPIPSIKPGDQEEGDEEPAPSGHEFLPDLKLMIRAERFMDIAVPRTRSAVRHGAEKVGELQLTSFIKL